MPTFVCRTITTEGETAKADQPEPVDGSIELTPASMKALEELVSELDDEVEGFDFDQSGRPRPQLEGSATLRIGDKPIKVPINIEPKGILISSAPR